MASGFQLHLSKPVGFDRLAAAIASIAPNNALVGPSTTLDEAKANTLRALIVEDEDNEDTALYISTALEQQGHQVAVARDGPSSLETAVAFQPGAILLDLGLPGMDGYEVARRLRQTSGLQHIVIAAVSGYAENAHGNDNGLFDYYIIKPVWPEKLYALIDDLRLRASKKI